MCTGNCRILLRRNWIFNPTFIFLSLSQFITCKFIPALRLLTATSSPPIPRSLAFVCFCFHPWPPCSLESRRSTRCVCLKKHSAVRLESDSVHYELKQCVNLTRIKMKFHRLDFLQTLFQLFSSTTSQS